MRLLQNPLHLRILIRLAQSPLDVSGLQDALGLDQSHISHALAKLKGCGALESERVKKRQIYRLSELIQVSACDDAVGIAVKCRNGDALRLSLVQVGPAIDRRLMGRDGRDTERVAESVDRGQSSTLPARGNRNGCDKR